MRTLHIVLIEGFPIIARQDICLEKVSANENSAVVAFFVDEPYFVLIAYEHIERKLSVLDHLSAARSMMWYFAVRARAAKRNVLIHIYAHTGAR